MLLIIKGDNQTYLKGFPNIKYDLITMENRGCLLICWYLCPHNVIFVISIDNGIRNKNLFEMKAENKI